MKMHIMICSNVSCTREKVSAEKVNKTRSFDFAFYITVKEGKVSDEDLQRLSQKIAANWKQLGRRLKIEESRLIAFHKENEEFSEKAYQMLLHWKQRDGSAASYQVLHDALTHSLVSRRDLAEEICGG